MAEFTSRTELTANLQSKKAGRVIDKFTGYDKFLADVIGFDEYGRDTEWGKFRAFISNLHMGVPGDKVADLYRNEIMTNKTDDAGKAWRSNDVQRLNDDLMMAQITSDIEGGKAFASFASMGASMGGSGGGGEAAAAGGPTDALGGLPEAGATEIALGEGTSAFDEAFAISPETSTMSAGQSSVPNYGAGPLQTVEGDPIKDNVVKEPGMLGTQDYNAFGGDWSNNWEDKVKTVLGQGDVGMSPTVQMDDVESAADKKYQSDMAEIQQGYQDTAMLQSIPVVGTMAYSIFNENAKRDQIDSTVEHYINNLQRELSLEEYQYQY